MAHWIPLAHIGGQVSLINQIRKKKNIFSLSLFALTLIACGTEGQPVSEMEIVATRDAVVNTPTIAVTRPTNTVVLKPVATQTTTILRITEARSDQSLSVTSTPTETVMPTQTSVPIVTVVPDATAVQTETPIPTPTSVPDTTAVPVKLPTPTPIPYRPNYIPTPVPPTPLPTETPSATPIGYSMFMGAGTMETGQFRSPPNLPWMIEWETQGEGSNSITVTLMDPESRTEVNEIVTDVGSGPLGGVNLVWGNMGTFYLKVEGPDAGWKIWIRQQ